MITSIWPEPPVIQPLWERIAIRSGRIPGFCSICEHAPGFRVGSTNLREDVICRWC